MNKFLSLFNKNNMKRFFFSFIWLAVLMIFLDQLSKILIVMNKDTILAAGSEGVILIPNFLAVNYVINTNIIFGLSFIEDKNVTRILYIIIASLVVIGMIVYYVFKHKKMTRFSRAIMMLILAGAAGNLIDRIFYTKEFLGVPGVNNGVVDWINFYGIWKFNFNWADSCIVVGVILMIIYMIILEIKEYKENNKDRVKDTEKVLSLDEKKKLEQENKKDE